MTTDLMNYMGFRPSDPCLNETVHPGTTASLPNTQKNKGLFAGLKDNPLFTGGLAIAALTTGFQVIRKSSIRVASLLKRHLFITVEIPSSDPSYEWFLQFLAQHQRAQSIPLGNSNSKESLTNLPWTMSELLSRLSRLSPASRELAIETRMSVTASGASVTDFVLVPGQGKHLINYKSTFLQVLRQRDSKRVNLPSGTPFETLEVTTLYSRRSVLSELLQESQHMALKMAEGKTVVYNSWGTDWRPVGNPQSKRSISSVILAPGVKEDVMKDIRNFLDSMNWYRDRGIPYRRGYLLYGPPGTGKTSFVKAIAGYYDYNICMLNLSERGLTDDRLNHLLLNLPERSIALLEDADAAFANRMQVAEDGYGGANVTFSGLLNSIDGAASAENRIIILTTNHVDRLDGALLRPGRIDVKVEIGYATPEVVRGMWSRFYDSAEHGEDFRNRSSEKELDSLLNVMRVGKLFEANTQGISTAELQGLFLKFKNNPEGAVAEARKWFMLP